MMFRYTGKVAYNADQVRSVHSVAIQYSLSRPYHNTPLVMSCFVPLLAYRSSDCCSQLQLLVHNLQPHPAVYDVSQLACQLHTLSSAAPDQVVTACIHCSCIDSSFLQLLCKCACMMHSSSCKAIHVFQVLARCRFDSSAGYGQGS